MYNGLQEHLLDNMIKENYFPTSVYIDKLNIDNDVLLKSILDLKNKEPLGIVRSNLSNNYHSKNNLHNFSQFDEISKGIVNVTDAIFKEQKIKTKFILGNLWANVSSKGGSNKIHNHPNSFLSGVYYVKTPENCGALKIYDPRIVSQMIVPEKGDDLNRDDWNEVKFKPQAGKIIFFPSYLQHEALPNESDEMRVSMSFNIILNFL